MRIRSLVLSLLLSWPAIADKDSALRAYERGDFGKAVHEWRALANKDDPEAEFRLAGMYERGEGTPARLDQAASWYRKAAYQGHGQAQYAFGLLLEQGKGIAQDYVLAHVWLKLATLTNEDKAHDQLEQLTAKMTPEQIAEAQRVVKEWAPAFPISRDVSSPIILSKVEPEYPADARKAHCEGTVILDVIIDQTGRPTAILAESPVKCGLDRKAVEAVSRWRFRPGSRNGNPVAVQSTITVSFREM